MIYHYLYFSPIGKLHLYNQDEDLIGLYFDAHQPDMTALEGSKEQFSETIQWLQGYFSHQPSNSLPKMKIVHSTPFRLAVIKEMLKIGYGRTATYGEIAKAIDPEGLKKGQMARAVGGAVGSNPISIIIPCHRVIGANHSLTGYSGGIENKIALLQLEGIDTSKLVLPKRKEKNETMDR